MNLLPITLSVKRGAFRGDQPSPPGSDVAYKQNRIKALKRDKHTCRFCDFQHQKNEVHHANDNHEDQSLDNLVTACVLCHMAHHIAFAGIQNRGSLIYLHDVNIDQAGLNQLVRSLWIGEKLAKGDLRHTASHLLSRLEKSELMAIQVIGTSNPSVLGDFMSTMKEAEYQQRALALKGVYLLPKKEAYKAHIESWSKDVGSFNPEEWVKKAEQKFAQWSENI